MAKKKIFISFAIEDEDLRMLLVGQSINKYSDFDFTDKSVHEPWDYNWKEHCRERIKRCDGVISIITGHTKYASGQLWEMKCAMNEGIPLLNIKRKDDFYASLPYDMPEYTIQDWTWDNISFWLDRI